MYMTQLLITAYRGKDYKFGINPIAPMGTMGKMTYMMHK